MADSQFGGADSSTAAGVALLDAGHVGAAVAVDPRLGVVCVGLHSASGRVRAVDAVAKRVLWEAPPDVGADSARRSIAIAGGRAYVSDSLASVLSAVDLATGRVGWRVQLPSAVQAGLGRICLADPYEAGPSPGAVVVQLDNEEYLALDRNTGRTLWTLPNAKDYGPLPAFRGVLLGLQREDRMPLWFVDPLRGPGAVCELPSAFALSRHYGPRVVVATDDIDGNANPGVAMIEMPSGRVLFRQKAPYEHRAGRPVLASPYVFSMDLLHLKGSPDGPGAATEMVPGFFASRLESTGATLVCLFTELRGQGSLRLAGYDPSTLRPRYYAAAELGRALKIDEGRSNVACVGAMALVVGEDPSAGPDESVEAAVRGPRPALKLTALNGDTGALAWTATLRGRFDSLETAGAYFVLRTDDRTWVFRPDRAQPLARFPL